MRPIIIRHYLKTFISRRNCTSDRPNFTPKWSYRGVNREMNRRIRDKKLEQILAAEQELKEIEEGHEESSKTDSIDFTKELNSVFVSNYFRQNLDKFSDVYPDVVDELKKRTNPPPKREKKTKTNTLPQYPFQKLTSVTLDSAKDEQKNEEKRVVTNSSKNLVSPDRGFFVYREDFKDEYIAGSALTLPQDREFAVIPYKELKPGTPVTYRKRLGPTDAVEEIEFQVSNSFWHI